MALETKVVGNRLEVRAASVVSFVQALMDTVLKDSSSLGTILRLPLILTLSFSLAACFVHIVYPAWFP
jgi:hypothetical protein